MDNNNTSVREKYNLSVRDGHILYLEEQAKPTEESTRAMKDEAMTMVKDLSEPKRALVNLTGVQVRTIPISQVSDFIAEPTTTVTGVKLGLAGEVFGQILLIFKEQSAINVVDFMQKRPIGITKELSELDKSALKEAGNILTGAFLSAISDYLSINVLELPPEFMNTELRKVVESAVAEFSKK